ncbi:NUDIX domain-containing protein [candidate division KSB1 bacterium]|nr:NUDIX domain-containing protein [candidate division KSB1 bacterium]
MITFNRDKYKFTYRVAGVSIHKNQVLLQTTEDSEYWFLPGGRCEFMENSKITLKREMLEELEVEIEIDRLLWLAEYFYEYNNILVHEIALYYLMHIPSHSDKLHLKSFIGWEGDAKMIYQWHPIENVEGLKIYPRFLNKKLTAIPSKIEHIIFKEL